MIAIAALALLCAWFARTPPFRAHAWHARNLPRVARFLYFDGPSLDDFPGWRVPELREYLWITPFEIIHDYLFPLTLIATPAALAFRLRKPRPDWVVILRQPGAVACLGVLATILLIAELSCFRVMIPRSFNPGNLGVIVAACWATLIVSRRWQSEAGWVDRLGRIVGVGWIAVTVVERWL